MIQFILFIIFIGLFIFGMTLLRSGLFNLSGDTLKRWVLHVTNAPWKGVLVGIVITILLQSSSAVMIITVGFVSAGLLSFPQSIGIILGSNIGTTMTTELITFNIESYLIPLAIIGAVLALMKKSKVRSIGFILLGISVVFSAIRGFEYIAAPLKDMAFINDWLLAIDKHHLYAVITGILIAAIIQSSTATTAIIMGFLSSGAMNLDTGIAIILGANIGTCVDVYLASIGSGREAKLTAYAHIWLNVLGVIAFYPFIGSLANLGLQLSQQPDAQLAHISVVFNVLSSLIVLPFTHYFARFVTKIHGR
ncbi:Na/Pi symporter [Bacillus rubiinfantis]|uniref:Na/Pi symporter n=1 Tax=Bacillus rubiinfantis TaxID=1499680 RepID=UPI0005AA71D5|nr:Na/Pi symporter [Bacillus rubiinfantis]